MNIETVCEYCLSLKGVTEEQPFGPTNVVYKVMGKIFALISLDEFSHVSLKNTPEKNEEIRERYNFVVGAWHMHKLHWSMINLNDVFDERLILELIDDSYGLVTQKLTKKQKAELADLMR